MSIGSFIRAPAVALEIGVERNQFLCANIVDIKAASALSTLWRTRGKLWRGLSLWALRLKYEDDTGGGVTGVQTRSIATPMASGALFCKITLPKHR
jgi:hypothetical protein